MIIKKSNKIKIKKKKLCKEIIHNNLYNKKVNKN